MDQRSRHTLADVTVPLLTLTVFVGALLAGCDSSNLEPNTERRSDRPPLAPNVRMQMSYDQTKVTYSSVLPPGVIGDVGNAQTNAQSTDGVQNKGVMKDYEAIHETRSYSEEGYLMRTYDYTDGWQGLNMPETTYNDFKEQMPRRTSKRSITGFELDGSTMRFVSDKGETVASASVDPEDFRIEPSVLDSLEALQDSASGSDQRKSRVRDRLQARGLTLEKMGAHHVAFETQSAEEGLSSIRRVVDLRTGQPVYLAYRKENGRLARVKTRTYGRYSGVPVMAHEVSYKYGDKDGSWAVVARTETERTNISVRFN